VVLIYYTYYSELIFFFSENANMGWSLTLPVGQVWWRESSEPPAWMCARKWEQKWTLEALFNYVISSICCERPGYIYSERFRSASTNI